MDVGEGLARAATTAAPAPTTSRPGCRHPSSSLTAERRARPAGRRRPRRRRPTSGRAAGAAAAGLGARLGGCTRHPGRGEAGAVCRAHGNADPHRCTPPVRALHDVRRWRRPPSRSRQPDGHARLVGRVRVGRRVERGSVRGEVRGGWLQGRAPRSARIDGVMLGQRRRARRPGAAAARRTLAVDCRRPPRRTVDAAIARLIDVATRQRGRAGGRRAPRPQTARARRRQRPPPPRSPSFLGYEDLDVVDPTAGGAAKSATDANDVGGGRGEAGERLR